MLPCHCVSPHASFAPPARSSKIQNHPPVPHGVVPMLKSVHSLRCAAVAWCNGTATHERRDDAELVSRPNTGPGRPGPGGTSVPRSPSTQPVFADQGWKPLRGRRTHYAWTAFVSTQPRDPRKNRRHFGPSTRARLRPRRPRLWVNRLPHR
jgi:hypothetical protein